jgi:hypothetical protein
MKRPLSSGQTVGFTISHPVSVQDHSADLTHANPHIQFHRGNELFKKGETLKRHEVAGILLRERLRCTPKQDACSSTAARSSF